MWFQLGNLVPALSESEKLYLENYPDMSTALRNALNLPHKLLTVAFSNIDIFSIPASRVASTVFGITLGISFWYLLKVWYSRRVAVFGSLLFISSAWFLHIARLGTDDVMNSLLILPLASVLFFNTKKNNAVIALNAFVLIMLLYVPGFIWFVTPLFIWQAKRIFKHVKNQNPLIIIFIFMISIGLLAPLAITLYLEPSLISSYFGLPDQLPSLSEYAKNLTEIPLNLFILGPENPVTWLGRLPLISWFSSIMFITGLYAYFFKRTLDRTWFITYALIAGSFLTALGGPITINVLLPFVYLVVAGGLALLLQQWFTIFPKNPLARTIGPSILSVVILLTVFYNLNHYFIAWPNTPETKSAYTKQLVE